MASAIGTASWLFRTLGATSRVEVSPLPPSAGAWAGEGAPMPPLSAQLDFLPPLRPAAFFWAVLPPLPLPELFLLRLLPLLLPPLLEDPSELEIAAARDLLMPFFRSPSYCLSFLTLEPWSFAIVLPPLRVQGSNTRGGLLANR